MKILIAEDEPDIRITYKIALENSGHEVILTENGEECINIYRNELKLTKYDHKNSNNKDHGNTLLLLCPPPPSLSVSVFDAVVLDYKMPKKDGIEVAKEILDLNPNQRIIFASAYVRDTLEDSVKQLNRVVELLQKPFIPDILVDTIEDRRAYEGLKKLIVNVKDMQKVKSNYDFTREQIGSLFDSLKKIQKGRSFVHFFLLPALTSIIICSTDSLVDMMM